LDVLAAGRVASCYDLFQRPLDFRKRGAKHGRSGVEYQVPLRSEPVPVQAECLTNSPLDAVALDRATHGARHGKPEPRPLCESCWSPLKTKRGEQGTGDAEAVFIDVPELGGAQDSRAFREWVRPVRGRLNHCPLSWPWRRGRLSHR
jgi:hypothetical protein